MFKFNSWLQLLVTARASLEETRYHSLLAREFHYLGSLDYDQFEALAQMLTLDIRGIVHATGTGDCTWYELASAIVSGMGRQTRVHPMTTAEAGRRTARPCYSVLANCVLKQSGITLPHWRDSLIQFVKSMGVSVPV